MFARVINRSFEILDAFEGRDVLLGSIKKEREQKMVREDEVKGSRSSKAKIETVWCLDVTFDFL